MSFTRSKSSVYKDSWLNQQDSPYVDIVVQPKQKELRFRYECEGRSAGSIPGENSTSDKKTFPTIKIVNYKGCTQVVVSCVTREKGDAKPRPHPHGLVGKDCRNGLCIKHLNKGEKPIKFENLGIQCIKKKEIVSALKDRTEKHGIDPYKNFSLSTIDPKKLVAEYDLNVICLCFQVYIASEDAPDQPNIPLPPVIMQPIFDKKGATLQIARVDRRSGSVRGEEELFILCDKIQRDDIKVKFFDNDNWSDNADFSPTDIHRQVAIVCKTPPYRDLQISHPTSVFFKLVRPSDGEESQAIEFSYQPDDKDPYKIGAKRKRNQPSYDNYLHQEPPQTKAEFPNIPACRFSKPGAESRKPDVKERLKRLVARRSASASQGKPPDEAHLKNTLPGEKFYSISSGNTGKVIEQDPMSTIDCASLLNLISPNNNLDDGDVRINLSSQPLLTIDESEVQMNISALNPFLTSMVGSNPITPVSVSDSSPMDQENTVLDLLAPMAQGFENVIVENVPDSMAQTIGSESTDNQTEIDATIQQMLNGGDVIIENFPSLSTYLNDEGILQEIQQQFQQHQGEQQQLEQQQMGDEYIFEEVHDSLNIPVFNSIDIIQQEYIHEIQKQGGTM